MSSHLPLACLVLLSRQLVAGEEAARSRASQRPQQVRALLPSGRLLRASPRCQNLMSSSPRYYR
jgi:hypothetical protein